MISKFFKTCALNLPVDGSQDSCIHCFKRDQPCAAGATQLQSQLSVLTECERPDPFKDISESDIEDAVDENYTVDNEGEDDDIIDIDIV